MDNTHYRCQCLACLERQGPPDPDELRDILFAGSLALLNGLDRRDPQSDHVLDRIIAQHDPPAVSYEAFVAFELMYVACSIVVLGLVWLYSGFAVLATFLSMLTVAIFLTYLAADEIDMEQQG